MIVYNFRVITYYCAINGATAWGWIVLVITHIVVPTSVTPHEKNKLS